MRGLVVERREFEADEFELEETVEPTKIEYLIDDEHRAVAAPCVRIVRVDKRVYGWIKKGMIFTREYNKTRAESIVILIQVPEAVLVRVY